MKISKMKIIIKYLTGSLAGVAGYVLDEFNQMIDRLPTEEVEKYAQLSADTATFISHLAKTVIAHEGKKEAAVATATCFADLALALKDKKLDQYELKTIIEETKFLIDAWKKA